MARRVDRFERQTASVAESPAYIDRRAVLRLNEKNGRVKLRFPDKPEYPLGSSVVAFMERLGEPFRGCGPRGAPTLKILDN